MCSYAHIIPTPGIRRWLHRKTPGDRDTFSQEVAGAPLTKPHVCSKKATSPSRDHNKQID